MQQVQVAQGNTLCSKGNIFLTPEPQWGEVEGVRNLFRTDVPCPAEGCGKVFPKLIVRKDGDVFLPPHAQAKKKKTVAQPQAQVETEPVQEAQEGPELTVVGEGMPTWVDELQIASVAIMENDEVVKELEPKPMTLSEIDEVLSEPVEKKHTGTCERPKDHKGKCGKRTLKEQLTGAH
jgi:hypothetical protein